MATIPTKYNAAIKKNTVFWRHLIKAEPGAEQHSALVLEQAKVYLSTTLQNFLQSFPTAIFILPVSGLSTVSSLTCICCNIFKHVLYMIRLLCHCPAESTVPTHKKLIFIFNTGKALYHVTQSTMLPTPLRQNLETLIDQDIHTKSDSQFHLEMLIFRMSIFF